MADFNATTAETFNLEGSFTEKLEGFAEMCKTMADEIFKSVAINVGDTVIDLTPIDTGHALANWQGSIDNNSVSEKEGFDPLNSSTSAKMAASFRNLKYGQTAYILNPVSYTVFLEYGSSKQAPNGMVRITLARFNEIVERAVSEISQ